MTKTIQDNNTPVVGFVSPAPGCDCDCGCKRKKNVKNGPFGPIKIVDVESGK